MDTINYPELFVNRKIEFMFDFMTLKPERDEHPYFTRNILACKVHLTTNKGSVHVNTESNQSHFCPVKSSGSVSSRTSTNTL